MKQYKELAEMVLTKGTVKPAARANMPGTTSLFGAQLRFNLADGFPIITSKYVNFTNIVTELMWFLKGETNISFLIKNGFHMWNQDAYNYYVQMASNNDGSKVDNKELFHQVDLHKFTPSVILKYLEDGSFRMYTYVEFVEKMKALIHLNAEERSKFWPIYKRYVFGDCGNQYGKTWRNWVSTPGQIYERPMIIDQIKNVLTSLKNHPESRRHIVTATDPGHDTEKDLALYWCHSMFQFNCRPLTHTQRCDLLYAKGQPSHVYANTTEEDLELIPKYYLDLQLYQRSGDLFLGVPYNISSYALLLSIFAKMLNMVPGEYIHTFGDVHIYDNHIDQIKQQLESPCFDLPELNISAAYMERCMAGLDGMLGGEFKEFNDPFIGNVYNKSDFWLVGYQHGEKIEGELSTGLIK